MKTAISVPDETFQQVERRAAALGMSRSEFFTQAARRYLRELDEHSLAARIDAALALTGIALAGTEEQSSADAVVAGRRLLATGEEDW